MFRDSLCKGCPFWHFATMQWCSNFLAEPNALCSILSCPQAMLVMPESVEHLVYNGQSGDSRFLNPMEQMIVPHHLLLLGRLKAKGVTVRWILTQMLICLDQFLCSCTDVGHLSESISILHNQRCNAVDIQSQEGSQFIDNCYLTAEAANQQKQDILHHILAGMDGTFSVACHAGMSMTP